MIRGVLHRGGVLGIAVAWLCGPAFAAQNPQENGEPKVDPRKEIPKLRRQLDAEDPAARKEAFEKLLEFGDRAVSQARSELRRLLTKYLREFRRARQAAHQKIRAGRDMQKIVQLREKAFAHLKAKEPDKMKPIVQELLKCFYPDMSRAGDDPKVREAAARVREIGAMLSRIDDRAPNAGELLQKDADELDKYATWSLMPGRDVRTIQRNEQLGKQIQEQEYAFVKLLNRYRIAMGRNAVEIDVKLCRAARGHSRDMKEKGFFSHDSPVPGKKTFGMRAAKEGTSAASENISRAGPSPESAFWSWFSSTKGHHENMLAPWRRIGIGNFAELWTANFG